MKFFVVLFFAVATVCAASLDISKRINSFNRIIKSHDATPDEAPYIVSLQLFEHKCAGSIIHPKWVLTAAHCLNFPILVVVAGLHSQNDMLSRQSRLVLPRHFIVHENFKGPAELNDIGLIYILEPFVFNKFIDQISLVSGNYPETGRGWGYVDVVTKPDVLQTMEGDIYDYQQCKLIWPTFAILMDSHNICIYKNGTNDGTCKGDSGGPLVRYTPKGVEQVGIVSWGRYKCTLVSFPNISTRISAFIKWISEKTSTFIPA